jgi:hypothetical protein
LRELNDSHTNDLLVEFERKAATGMIDLPVSFWFAIDRGYTSLFERLVEQYPNGPNPNGCVNKGRKTLVSELTTRIYVICGGQKWTETSKKRPE